MSSLESIKSGSRFDFLERNPGDSFFLSVYLSIRKEEYFTQISLSACLAAPGGFFSFRLDSTRYHLVPWKVFPRGVVRFDDYDEEKGLLWDCVGGFFLLPTILLPIEIRTFQNDETHDGVEKVASASRT